MKNALVVIFVWSSACIASPLEATNVYPSMIADVATNFFVAIRSNVAAQIRSQLSARVLGQKDLDGFIASLDQATNDLGQADFGKKLDSAAHQIETAQSRIDALLQDADSKLLAQTLHPEKWVESITSAKSQGNELRVDLLRLMSIIKELTDWSAAMEEVAPPSELTGILKTRLEHLLNEWEGRKVNPQKPIAGVQASIQATEKAQPKTAQRESLTGIHPAVVSVSPSAFEILKLAQAGVHENIILRRITNSRVLYNLSADDIIVIAGFGVPQPLIAAMLRHDSALKNR